MSIVNIDVGKNFICLLTDRGILLTKGRRRSGCIGHGDTTDVSMPKIVEVLLGEDVGDLSAGVKHLAVINIWMKMRRKFSVAPLAQLYLLPIEGLEYLYW